MRLGHNAPRAGKERKKYPTGKKTLPESGLVTGRFIRNSPVTNTRKQHYPNANIFILKYIYPHQTKAFFALVVEECPLTE